MEIFTDLGNRIEGAWRDIDHDEERFPAIAAEFLRNECLPSKVTPWEVLEWGLRQTEFPRQKDLGANFGDPPITLFTTPKFYIDIYFWFEGTTSIHQHTFCGAFQVLHGSSIHSWFDFERETAVNKFVEIGKMNLKVCELLETGAVQEIWGGRRYIHSLFHLDSPSATICVRTGNSPLEPPQYNYLKPGLAIDPFFEDGTVVKKIHIMSAILRAKRPNFDECVTGLLDKCDFESTYHLLSALKRSLHSDHIDQLFGLGSGKERLAKFIEIAKRRHGTKIDTLEAVFASADRTNEILRRRSFVTDPDLRFFLALVLNVEGKDRIYSLIRKRFPDAEPRDKVLDWVFELAQTRVMGGQEKQNALGVEPFDDLDLSIFEHLLNGNTGDEAVATIRNEYPTEKLDGLDERLAKVRNAVIFQPLFQ